MKRVFGVIIALATNMAHGAISDVSDSQSIGEAEAYTFSVRKVATRSDFVLIRPGYEIVIGERPSQAPLKRAATWQQPVAPTKIAPVFIAAAAPSPAQQGSKPSEAEKREPAVKPAQKTVALSETLFAFDSSSLTKSAKTKLDEVIADIENKKPERLRIAGHTDNRGPANYNQRLSERRADAVLSYLKAKGLNVVDVERVGFGESAPIDTNETPEGRTRNRRVEITATIHWEEGPSNGGH